jgi:cation diffusion facilitator CzcD-associated flavoprotein CzcO
MSAEVLVLVEYRRQSWVAETAVVRQVGHAVRARAQLLGRLRSCFARTQTWQHAGRYLSALVSDAALPCSSRGIQSYLAGYASRFGLDPALRLSTEVTSAAPASGGGWVLTTGGGTERVDKLVVANGVFCEPAVPRYPGAAEFTAAGGRVLAGSELHEEEQARGRRVLVVGYGKSACDIAVPISQVAASTDVVARHLLWKVPRRIGGFLNFKMLPHHRAAPPDDHPPAGGRRASGRGTRRRYPAAGRSRRLRDRVHPGCPSCRRT